MTAGTRPIRTLFIANRGEIARRIATSAARQGIRPVVPPIEGHDAVDLLDAAVVVRAAIAAGADAVHPGYGFLAEDPRLAAAVEDAGRTWVGPPPAAIRALGDKAEARAIARRAGVPVAEGEEPEDQSDASLASAAERIGYPVLVKPVAGGGGKGIRVVQAASELGAALASARREAARAFADERLLLERYLADARHVEVQVLADAQGAVVHLGDRDCSLQRRHQKVVEEAPAPGLDGAIRRALWEAAVRLATAVGYVNAGTCEFLVGEDGEWVFLELNARLQVEHPVTELVIDRDLVADQLGIAAGASLANLGLDQAAIERAFTGGGHAIEARLNAEDPASGFLPSAGRIVALRWPVEATAFGPVGAAGIRVDAGIEAGDAVGGRFDPLLAKVIAHGPDRETALARLSAALDATEVLGLPTNLAFLRRLVQVPAMVEGRARTTTLGSDPDAIDAAGARTLDDAAWLSAARRLGGRDRREQRDSHEEWGGGWRLNGPARLRLVADAGGEPVRRTIELPARIEDEEPGRAVGAGDGDTAFLSVDGRSVAFRLEAPPDLAAGDARAASGGGDAHGSDLLAPMPGVVVGVHVRPGDAVTAGDRVATLEAMKMEHTVTAPRDGHVEEIAVHQGEQVERGQVVARLGVAS